MEFLILLVILVLFDILLRYVFSVNTKKIKELGNDEYLDKIVEKYPENIDICKSILKKLDNSNVKVEENPDSNTTLYLVMSNKILIANLKKSYTRIQTIAHECLHSVQDKRILWSNFIFSNVYLIYFFIIAVLGILKLLHNKMLFLNIFILLGLIFYVIRMYLENDAMIKARFLAKEYMEEKKISSKEEIDKIIQKYDELNNMGIKYINFNIFENIIIKTIILSFVFFIL